MSIQADTRPWRQRHRLYGVRVPCAEMPAHLINGWAILSAAGDVREDVLMRPPSGVDAEAA